MISPCLIIKKLPLQQQGNIQIFKGMKLAITTVFLVLFTVSGNAQEGTVNIQQDRRISELLDVYKRVNSEVNYYTIQIGFGSYEKAEKLKADVAIDFPDLYSKIIFDSPTYRVQLGRFNSKLEVEREYAEVRKKYPESLILSPEKKPR